jgi:hypothetical protein
VGVQEDLIYGIDSVPSSFYREGSENVVMVGDLHAMDEKPSSRLKYVRDVADDLNDALERYNSDTIVFNGDTGSPDHLGTMLEELEAEQAIILEGDEDRKKDEERNYTGWARLLDRDTSDHFDTDVDYSLEGEHVRLDDMLDLPGRYPVQVQHYPGECRDSTEDLGFEASWFASQALRNVYGYDLSPTMRMVQAAFHSHTHGYDAREVGNTALVSLGGLRDNYVTNGNLPDNSVQAVSFMQNGFEVVHEGRESGEMQESQRFRETADGFKLVESRGKDALRPQERYEKDELPHSYLKELDRIASQKIPTV